MIGAKPAAVCRWIFDLLGAVCRWIFDLLGAVPGDSLDDLLPGSGAITQAWAALQTISRPRVSLC